jgi:L-ascorbate metabolism protein UlaG (beta-lactamase superfamily)
MLTVTRVNHASVLLDFDGQTILTDPWFSEKPGYHPGEPRGVALADLPPLAGVLVSHGHYDHYDMEAFRAYPDKAVPMIVKRGTARAARAVGFTRVTELDPWETAQLGPLTVTATPAKHKVPENTYILQGRGHTVYFGADTLLIPGLRAIAPRFPRIDLALLAINGLRLRPLLNRQVVMGPQDAAELCALLRPRVVVPIHYTFTGGPLRDRLLIKVAGTPRQVLDAFTQAVARRAPETAVRVLAPGQPLQIRDTIGDGSWPNPATSPSGVAWHTPGRAEGQVRPC